MDQIQIQPTAHAKKLILVAEDDSFYSKIYQSKLTAEGFDVALAANGNEALKFMQTQIPDLLLLDLIMPEKDGFQTLEELRRDDKTKDLKVIVLTNLSQDEDIKKVRALGVIEYIVKTDISIQDLVRLIKSSLSPL